MEIFCENGHLTNYGFQALIEGRADEQARLEISEHLDYCTDCMEQYLIRLEQITLLEPPSSKHVHTLTAKQSVRAVMRKYAMVGVAACFAASLYFFTPFASQTPQASESIASATLIMSQWSNSAHQFLQAFPQSIETALDLSRKALYYPIPEDIEQNIFNKSE